MSNKLDQHKNGFTIIEVVLVLAIAGLIFLMVFIALPALQRSQRDAQRKRTANLIIDGYTRVLANSRNQTNLTSTGNIIFYLVNNGYLKREEALDPSTGELPVISLAGGGIYSQYMNVRPTEYMMDTGYYDSEGIPRDTGGVLGGPLENQNLVLVVGLESGGYYCASRN